MDQWIETGYSSEAVAIFGISSKRFQTAVQKNQFTPGKIDVPYKKDMVRETGKKPLYAYPIIQNMQIGQKELADRIIKHYKTHKLSDELVRLTSQEIRTTIAFHDNKPPLIPHHFDIEEIKGPAESHAILQSIKDVFEQFAEFRTDVDSILTATIKKYPDSYETFRQNYKSSHPFFYDTDSIEEGASKKKVQQCLRFLRENPDIKPEQWLSQRGVLVYLNSTIFEGENEVILGYENDTEIAILSKHPLPLSTISGIEIL